MFSLRLLFKFAIAGHLHICTYVWVDGKRRKNNGCVNYYNNYFIRTINSHTKWDYRRQKKKHDGFKCIYVILLSVLYAYNILYIHTSWVVMIITWCLNGGNTLQWYTWRVSRGFRQGKFCFYFIKKCNWPSNVYESSATLPCRAAISSVSNYNTTKNTCFLNVKI